jgi:hypothetical protein
MTTTRSGTYFFVAATATAIVAIASYALLLRKPDNVGQRSPGRDSSRATPGPGADRDPGRDGDSSENEPPRDGTGHDTEKKPPAGNTPAESVPSEVIELYGSIFRTARPRSDLPEGWRERILKNSKWDADTHCWATGSFGIEWPSLVLKDFGGPKSNNMPKRVAADQLASWLEEEVREGRAIPLSQAERIAEEFARQFVANWTERNYRMTDSGWESAGPSVGGSNEVSHGWYCVNFAQAPITSAGEVVVTKSPILVCVDPWTSEVLWYARNIEGRKRIEPRIAFCGPLLSEARASELWEAQLKSSGFFLSPESTAEFAISGAPAFVLRVEVTWDEFGIASGRPVWDIEFQLKRVDRDPDPEGRTSRVRVYGRMKIDARSGETVQFSTRN